MTFSSFTPFNKFALNQAKNNFVHNITFAFATNLNT